MAVDIEGYLRTLPPRLKRLVRTLEASGYVFTNPEHVLPGPASDVVAKIERVEELVGPLPVALALFYRWVGSVDLTGSHPRWQGCDYPGPLVVEPIVSVVEEAQEYSELEDPMEEYWGSDSGVFRAPVAPDALHRADVSGGMWYGVEVPNSRQDPIVLEEPHALPFTQYLELSLNWGGFPGLDSCSSHSWPLELLRAATRAVQPGDEADEA